MDSTSGGEQTLGQHAASEAVAEVPASGIAPEAAAEAAAAGPAVARPTSKAVPPSPAVAKPTSKAAPPVPAVTKPTSKAPAMAARDAPAVADAVPKPPPVVLPTAKPSAKPAAKPPANPVENGQAAASGASASDATATAAGASAKDATANAAGASAKDATAPAIDASASDATSAPATDASMSDATAPATDASMSDATALPPAALPSETTVVATADLEVPVSEQPAAAPAEAAPEVEVENCYRLAFSAVRRKGKGKGKAARSSETSEAAPGTSEGAATAVNAGGSIEEKGPDAAETKPDELPGSSVSDVSERKTWTCPTCDEPNRIERVKCNSCGAERPEPVMAPAAAGGPAEIGRDPVEDAVKNGIKREADEEGPQAAKRPRLDEEVGAAAEEASLPASSPSPLASPTPEPKEPRTLAQLPVSKLKAIARYKGISIQGCLEKADMVAALRAAGIDDKVAHEEDDAGTDKVGTQEDKPPEKPLRAPKAAWRNWKPAFAATPYIWEPPPPSPPVDDAPILGQSPGAQSPFGGVGDNRNPMNGVSQESLCWEFKRGNCPKGALCRWVHMGPQGPINTAHGAGGRGGGGPCNGVVMPGMRM